MNECFLKMKGICKEFSGVRVLNDVQLGVKPGEVHVLLGENGAGKSTLIKILSGAYTRTSGEILINDEPARIHKPTDAFRYGIGVIYQEFNLNPYMSIYENLFLGKEQVNQFGFIDRKRSVREAEQVLKRVGLEVTPVILVKDLSIAQMQLVEIAKAIMCNVRILVFDEPTATLTDNETERLFTIIEELKAHGVSIIYISHRINELKRIGDRCTVLRDGDYIDTVVLSEVEDCDLIKMMVGRKVEFNKKAQCCAGDEEVLRVDKLCYAHLLKDVTFSLKRGEILGVAGLVGSGRTEMAKCIIGEYPAAGRGIFIKGKRTSIKSPSDAIRNGIVYLSEDRKNEGLILKHDVLTNATLPTLDKLVRLGLINLTSEKECGRSLVSRFKIKTHSLNTLIRNLSGGNQQKVVIAKWVNTGADVYIFDEPTRGIDVGARQEIYSIMEELAREGASIIMISSDLVEVLRMSDRILVMHQGRVAGCLDNTDDLSQETILRCAIGR
jgi:ribose transport system ATP-binding protein